MTEALALVRRWVNDYFNRHDAASARDFCAPDYALDIGDIVLAGRDEAWLPAVDLQMAAWPGLTMTVHQTLAGDGWAAVWFSEHGASRGLSAVWSGVAIYRADNGWLTGCIAQEDYLTRRRQVKTGTMDTVDPPCVAPWDTPNLPPNPEAETIVHRWLAGNWPCSETTVRSDDEHITGAPMAFDVTGMERCFLWSSGDVVAFHTRQCGIYRGGLPSSPASDLPETLDVNGIVRVEGGRVVSGRVIRDRMGLWARLRTAEQLEGRAS